MEGGVPPYSFSWSNLANVQSIGGLVAGYYKVVVTDANMETASAEITLVQPGQVQVQLVPYEYPTRYHVSCHACYNGSIEVVVSGGVAPYEYLWRDGATIKDRSNLGARDYQLTVTDANGCIIKSETVLLREPGGDWTMAGNTNTVPGDQFIGTIDDKDLVFKTSGMEGLRITRDGEIVSAPLSFDAGYELMMIDSSGTLKNLSVTALESYIMECQGCPTSRTWPWLQCGNHVRPDHFIGSTNEAALRFKTNGQIRMTLAANGKLGIGTLPPNNGSIYKLYVADGISTRDVKVTADNWPDYVFADGYRLMPLPELRAYLKQHRHLPGIPTAAEVERNEGVEVGDMQVRLLKALEEQALYILHLEERIKALEER